MTDTNVPTIDVAILGGGLAGNFLARQLRLDVPDASVAVFEKTDQHRWKVGESTVEIASNYMVRKLGLSTYLYDQQLPKMGLRFFFDTPEKNAELCDMSEIGTDRPPAKPSFQLDRARIEADLRVMNADMGADIQIGWTARDVKLGEGGEPHRFVVVNDDGERRAYRARWLIDATGRESTVARIKDLCTPEPVHQLMAVWGRYENVRDIDQIRNHAWRNRAGYIARSLSTNHFCYPGYWIWFIPLGRGVMSVGVVGEKHIFRRGMRQEEGFRAFIDEHRAPSWLMENAVPLDIEGYTQLAYGVKQFFSTDRWGLIGDAGAFTDPFYSPGSDFISTACDFLTDLIKRDRAGESGRELAERTDAYDGYMRFRWETTMPIYRQLYSTFGSYELLRIKFNFDLGCYFNLLFDPFALDKHLDLRYLKGQLTRQGDTLTALNNFAELFRRCEASLRSRNNYYRSNLGHYSLGIDCVKHFLDEIGTPRKKKVVDQRTEDIFNYARDESLKLLERTDVQPRGPLRLYEFAEHLLA